MVELFAALGFTSVPGLIQTGLDCHQPKTPHAGHVERPTVVGPPQTLSDHSETAAGCPLATEPHGWD